MQIPWSQSHTRPSFRAGDKMDSVDKTSRSSLDTSLSANLGQEIEIKLGKQTGKALLRSQLMVRKQPIVPPLGFPMNYMSSPGHRSGKRWDSPGVNCPTFYLNHFIESLDVGRTVWFAGGLPFREFFWIFQQKKQISQWECYLDGMRKI